jgi:hypothetical protein
MATTGKGFIVSAQGAPVTTLTASSGVIIPLASNVALQFITQGLGTRVDAQKDLASSGYAKNGAIYLSLAASTPVTVDMTATSGTATSSGGDTAFATAFDLQLTNLGAQDVIVGNAASHPFLGPLGGTTPTIVIPAGSSVHLSSIAGWSITGGTNNNLKFDPGGSAAQIAVAIGGA